MLKKILIYLLGNVLSRAIIFVLLPVYSTYIVPEEYGYYDIVITYLSFITSSFCLEIWTTLLRFAIEKKDKASKYKIIQNAGFILSGSIFLILIAVLIAHLCVDIEYAGLVMAYAFVLCSQNFYTYIARALDKNTCFAVSGIVAALFNVAINIALIIGWGFDYSALYYSFIIAGIVQCLYIENQTHVLKHFKRTAFDKCLIKEMLRFSWPFSINLAFFWLLNSYSKTVIASELGMEANGYFSMAAKFGAIIQMLTGCIIMAWQENAFQKGVSSDSGIYYTRMGDAYLKLLICGGCLFIPIIYIVYPFIINEQYAVGLSIVPPYIIATIFSVYASFLTAIFGAIKETSKIFYTTVAGALVNVITIHLLVGEIGIQAAVWSMIGGHLTCVMYRLYLLRRSIHMKLKAQTVCCVLIPSILISFWAYYSNRIFCDIFAIFLIMGIMVYACKEQLENIIGQFKALLLKSNK